LTKVKDGTELGSNYVMVNGATNLSRRERFKAEGGMLILKKMIHSISRI